MARRDGNVIGPFHTNRRSLTEFGMTMFSRLVSFAEAGGTSRNKGLWKTSNLWITAIHPLDTARFKK